MAAGDTVKPDYENFEPLCKWKREQEHDTLEVHLQGFRKDEMKVQLNSTGMMIISGKRHLDETKTKWSHFKKEIALSKDYKKNKIHAKLSSGILHIIMPKKSSSTTTTIVQEQPPLPPENKENETNRPKATIMPKKSLSTTSNVQEQSKMLSENEENERNKPKTTPDTIANNSKDKELSYRKNVTRSENSKLASYGGFRVRDLITNKKIERNVALAIALASILFAFVIYKYRQPSYVNDN